MIIGADNGVSGALVAISGFDGSIISQLPMPTQKIPSGREIDILAVWKWINNLDSRDKISVVIEEPVGSKSATASRSMAASFAALRTVCVLKALQWHRITPQQWQKVLLPRCKAGDTKPRALALAKQLWPDETFLANKRCRVPHDGLIDAALIAEYARRARL